VATAKADLRWGVEQRLEFIEFRLFWEGHVNRGDLMEAFGVSVNQASTDLNRYIGMAPQNMHYDKSARAYVRGAEFAPQFLKPDASRYLAQLKSVADGIGLRHTQSASTGSAGIPGRSVSATEASRTSFSRGSSRPAAPSQARWDQRRIKIGMTKWCLRSDPIPISQTPRRR